MGLWVVKTAEKVGAIPKMSGEIIDQSTRAFKNDVNEWDPFNPDSQNEPTLGPRNFKEVVKEIKGDLQSLQDYLQHSVFSAAGFIIYCTQEIERVRYRFVALEENERRWEAIVRREAKRQNPNIPFKIANRLQDFRLRREIALDIKETREFFMGVH